jgi:hypothetical protein
MPTRRGHPRRCSIGRAKPTTFTIDWKGSYRIKGAAFVYRDRETGRLTTIHGYPTNLPMAAYPRTVLEFRDWFADDAACRDYLVRLR